MKGQGFRNVQGALIRRIEHWDVETKESEDSFIMYCLGGRRNCIVGTVVDEGIVEGAAKTINDSRTST